MTRPRVLPDHSRSGYRRGCRCAWCTADHRTEMGELRGRYRSLENVDPLTQRIRELRARRAS